MASKGNFPIVDPSLNLDFANTKQLDPRITFSRTSIGTYFDQLGVMRTAPSGAARFDHNPVTGESLGLLIEEQRTNLVLNGTVTLSGTGSGELVGTGEYPTLSTLVFTPTAGTLILTVTGSVTLAQLEVGAFPTSYIPTVASQVTRAADIVSMTGTNFSSWFNPTEGTLFGEATIPSAVFTFRTIALLGRSTNSSYEMYLAISRSSNSLPIVAVIDNTAQLSYNPAGVRLISKQGCSYATNNSIAAIDGELSSLVSSCTVPTALTTLYIGNADSPVYSLNGHIKRISYYPIRLTDAQLQALTT